MADNPIVMKVLSYNVHLFFDTVAGLAPEYQDSRRLDGIIKHIQAVDADLVGLSEAWADSTKQKICSRLRRRLPYSFYEGNDSGRILGSGLLLLSRYRIVSQSFVPFDALTGWDASSRKGILTVKLLAKQAGWKQNVFALLAHTQSGNSSKEITARKKNIEQIRTVLRSLTSGTRPAVVLGDLNVVAERGALQTVEYQRMMKIFGPLKLSDLYRSVYKSSAADPGYTYDYHTNALAKIFAPKERVRERLDYIFVRNCADGPGTRSATVVLDFKYSDPNGGFMDLSDHYPLLGQVEIR